MPITPSISCGRQSCPRLPSFKSRLKILILGPPAQLCLKSFFFPPASSPFSHRPRRVPSRSPFGPVHRPKTLNAGYPLHQSPFRRPWTSSSLRPTTAIRRKSRQPSSLQRRTHSCPSYTPLLIFNFFFPSSNRQPGRRADCLPRKSAPTTGDLRRRKLSSSRHSPTPPRSHPRPLLFLSQTRQTSPAYTQTRPEHRSAANFRNQTHPRKTRLPAADRRNIPASRRSAFPPCLLKGFHRSQASRPEQDGLAHELFSIILQKETQEAQRKRHRKPKASPIFRNRPPLQGHQPAAFW